MIVDSLFNWALEGVLIGLNWARLFDNSILFCIMKSRFNCAKGIVSVFSVGFVLVVYAY